MILHLRLLNKNDNYVRMMLDAGHWWIVDISALRTYQHLVSSNQHLIFKLIIKAITDVQHNFYRLK